MSIRHFNFSNNDAKGIQDLQEEVTIAQLWDSHKSHLKKRESTSKRVWQVSEDQGNKMRQLKSVGIENQQSDLNKRTLEMLIMNYDL